MFAKTNSIIKIDKTIYQLINETEDIVREKRKKEKQECQDLKKLKSTNEKEIRKLKNQLLREQERINLFGQKGRENINGKKELKQSNDHMAQQLKDKEEIIKSLKREIEGSKKTTEIFEVLVQSKNNESDLLKKDNKRLSDLEQENREEIRELKRRLQEKHQELMSLTDNATTHSPGPSNQDLLANIPNGVTTMVKIEDSDSRSCQAGNKKRKL
jgi:chromosome segregation ATPase